eukprot:1626255-Amphidinium_carterae.1
MFGVVWDGLDGQCGSYELRSSISKIQCSGDIFVWQNCGTMSKGREESFLEAVRQQWDRILARSRGVTAKWS